MYIIISSSSSFYCLPYYLDDILIASSTPHQHIEDLHMVRGRLKQFGLTIRLEKCIFGVSEIDFLGHEICKNGSIPQPAKAKPISNFPQANTVKSLQGFQGMVNFYHHYIPQAASILHPLYCSLKGKSQKDSPHWCTSMKQSFQHAKSAYDATMLAHPITNAPIAITTDASEIGLGATLEQYVNNNW